MYMYVCIYIYNQSSVKFLTQMRTIVLAEIEHGSLDVGLQLDFLGGWASLVRL